LRVTDFPLLLTWLSNDHVKQWWNDGDNTLDKVAMHYGAEEPDVARFILIESTEAGESPLGYFQYYINNTPDIFLNGSTRLSEFMVQGSSYFFKVSSASDLKKKILSTAE